jgi:hypothetical protein
MHRQVNSYSAEECIRDMDAAGVDACLLHPPGWDPNSGKISEEAAAKYPNRFGILGNFPLDKPESRSLIDGWKKRPGMLGLRFAFTQPHQANWMTDGTMDGCVPPPSRVFDRADGVRPAAAGRETPSTRAEADHRPNPPVRDASDAAHGNQPACWHSPSTRTSRSNALARPEIQPASLPQHPQIYAADRRGLWAGHASGHRHNPHAVSWKQCVTVHRGMPWLEPRPRLVMGRAVCDWLG